ncbi:MAG: hypothetical protein HMLIMOIP_000930 [Candidatus Nitrosomirales archaeon]|jgi:hypothetical protein
MAGRAIRPSQFILTYGVGSILEMSRGTRIIRDFYRWGRRLTDELHRFQIEDVNAVDQLRQFSNKPVKIFRLPTNAELRIPDGQSLYQTDVFPRWSLCMKHGGTPILAPLSDKGLIQCIPCEKQGIGDRNRSGIRFIMACSAGHMSDIDWYGMVHRTRNNRCSCMCFEWEGEGEAANKIAIRCISCKKETKLSDIYRVSKNDKLRCLGRWPERNTSSDTCNRPAKIILRSASNLRVSEVLTSITIPHRDTALYRILANDHIYGIVSQQDSWTIRQLAQKLRGALPRNPDIREVSVAEIEEYTDEELSVTLQQLFKDRTRKSITPDEVKEDEFFALSMAALDGHPPEHSGRTTHFVVEKEAVVHRLINSRWQLPFTITPVKTLRVVLVQRGFKRSIGGDQPTIVDTYYDDGEYRWYPGISLLGEGIFIHFEDARTEPRDSAWDEWIGIFNDALDVRYHPTFVWWHSLSHRIINSLAVHSGYSSASIRERVYAGIDESTGKMRGGVLLYTSQTGGDGTLGGLIALVPKFDRILEGAAANIHSCSNDPLCTGQKVTSSKVNGAACYTCMFVSETSCEYRNQFLDRNLLRVGVKL